VAVDVLHPKTAAVFYDRLWAGITVWEPDVPIQILFAPKCDELFNFAMEIFFGGLSNDGPGQPESYLSSYGREVFEKCLQKVVIECKKGGAPTVTMMFRGRDSFETTVFGQIKKDSKDSPRHRRGKSQSKSDILVVTTDQMDLLDESALRWDQVLEFRKDADAARKVRWFLRWLDVELSKIEDPNEIRDVIAERLAAYRSALKKHGMATAVGFTQVAYSIGAGAGLSELDKTLGLNVGMLPIILGGLSLHVVKSVLDFSQGRTKIDTEFKDVALLYSLQR
jgi:hypothetical protein